MNGVHKLRAPFHDYMLNRYMASFTVHHSNVMDAAAIARRVLNARNAQT